MATVDMTFGPGSSTIRTGAGGIGGGGGGIDPGVSGLLQQVLNRRMAAAEEDRRRRMAVEDEQAGDRATARRRDQVEYNLAAAERAKPGKVAINRADNSGIRRPQIGGENSGGAAIRAAQETAQSAELDSAMRGPMQRYVTAGPGIVGGGLTNDLSRMNAIDRKLYLPGGSGLAAGPAEHDLGEEAEIGQDRELRRRARTNVMERMAAGAPISGSAQTVRG